MPTKRDLSMRQSRHLLRGRAGDRATSLRGALDDPGQSEAGSGGRTVIDDALERQLFGRAGGTQASGERTGRLRRAS
jgi:hypothetical protein